MADDLVLPSWLEQVPDNMGMELETPSTKLPFVRFLDSSSKLVKGGTYMANVLLDTVKEETHKLPIRMQPMVVEVGWVEWPEDANGNAILDEQPKYQTNSYQDALNHFPRDARGRSEEYFYRNYIILANFEGIEDPRLIQIRGGSAASVERLVAKAKTVKFPGSNKNAPLFSQWWKLGSEMAKSKNNGAEYVRLTLNFDSIEYKESILQANFILAKNFDKGLMSGDMRLLASGD